MKISLDIFFMLYKFSIRKRINSWWFLRELSVLLNSPSLPLGIRTQGMSMAGFDFQRLKCR